MDRLDALIDALKSGTMEEKCNALTGLTGLSESRALDAIREVWETSDDAELSLMACYALAMNGDSEAAEALKKMSFIDKHFSRGLLKSLDMLNRIKEVEEAHQVIYRAHPLEAREKLKKLLPVFLRCFKQNGSSNRIFLFNGTVDFIAKKNAGLIFSYLGLVELRLGNIYAALRYGEKAFSIGNEIQDGQVLSTALGSLGIVYMEMDKYYQALDCFQKSLDIIGECIGSRKNRVLYYMSLLYCKLGDTDNALKFAKDALEEARREKDDLGIGWCLNAKGAAYLNLKRDTEAEAYFVEALEYCNKTGDRQGKGNALVNLGYIDYERKRYKSAENFLYRALKIFEDTGNKSTAATVLVNLAHLYLGHADTDKAYECALDALSHAEDTASLKDDADACYILGRITHIHYRDFESAYAYYRRSIELYETIRKDLVADELKIAFAENSASCYAQMISLCVDLGRKEEAFQYVERSKSRALVELLSKTLDDIKPRAGTADRMEEVKRLENMLGALKIELRSLYKKSRSPCYAEDEKADLVFEPDEVYPVLHSVERQYKEAYEELKRLDPEFASFAGVAPVKIEDLRKLLDKDTYLVEYYLTDEKIFIFVISPELEMTVCQIGIDINAESDKLSLLFKNLYGSVIHDTESHDFYKGIKFPFADFYDLLIGPIEEKVTKAKRLVFAPHRLLHYLPFHALFDRKRSEYLIDRYEIAYTPSAEVLKYCHKRNEPTRKLVAIFANPSGDLPHAEEEAQKIATCFKPDGKLYIGKEATLKNLETLDDVDIVHIACHGIYRADEPIFSHLLLAETAEGQGECFLPDIFNLELKTPTLVTLSACESGLSHFSSGDELVGFARGFFYAGTPSIVASLWRVNDKSTCIFMEVFYRHIKNLLPKSEALQLAIQEIKSRSEYQHPYFWAPFVLMGDWI